MKFKKSLNIPKLLLFFILSTQIPLHGYSFEPDITDSKIQIVIDPGHGGNDTGGRSVSGLMEKDFTLYLAFAVKNKLDKHFNVTLTRASDYSMTDIQRTDIANSANASLFVSLHAGSLFTQKGMKNILIGYSGEGKFSLTDHDSVLTDIKNAFEKKDSNVSVMKAPFNTAYYLTMPFIMIEAGNLNSPSESISMKHPDFIEKTADTIAMVLSDFLNKQTVQEQP
ncbi:MAG: N-acetylmuramoyl-L-alanine amidase [Desulfobacteraceae bacterium]